MQDLNTSPLSSSLSSPDTTSVPDACSAAVDPILGLLLRERTQGGYGGRVSFSEFVRFSRAVGWSTEHQEDIWYELVEGVPLAETRKVQLLADMLSQVCTSPRSFALLPLSTPTAATGAGGAPGVGVTHASPAENASSHLLHEPSASLSIFPKHETAPRYALPTTASAYRTSHKQFLQALLADEPRPASRHRRRPAPAATATSATPSSAKASVFERLYAPPAATVRSTSAAIPSQSTVDSDGAKRPQPSPRKTVPGGGASDLSAENASSSAHRPARRDAYKKPTQSYFAKLVGASPGRHHDPIADAPETPRVAYQPAPGPSCCVPPGYVEGVARRRQQAAARFYGQHFEETLRRPSFRSETAAASRIQDAEWLASAPILRLPLSTQTGGRGAVDVRLAIGVAASPREDPRHSGYCAIHLGTQEKRAHRCTSARDQSALRGTRSPLTPLSNNTTGPNSARRHSEHSKAHDPSLP